MKRDLRNYAIAARRHIRESFASLPIFGRARGLAVYHYCAVLEVESFKAEASLAKHFSVHRSAVESSDRAIPALYEHCPPTQTPLAIDQGLFAEAHELFVFSRNYEQVEFCFELADRGQFEIHVAARDPRITFAYASKDSDTTDTLRRSGETLEVAGLAQEPEGNDAAAILSAASDVRNVLEGDIGFTSKDCIEYQYNPNLVAQVVRWARLLENAVSWHIAPTVKLGLISFADVRRFWGAALAVSNTHDMAHLIACKGDINKWPIGSRVHQRRKDEWIRILAEVSGLSIEIASNVLEWLIFDPKVSAKTPMLQPFIEVAPTLLCAPSPFFIGSNFERNFLKLLNRHPSMRQYGNIVKASKEPLALAELAARFPEPAYRTKPQVALPDTDADLVIYECASGWAIVLQHKWLIAPDTANESKSNDEELNNGVQQALRARDYWRANLDHLRKTLSLSPEARPTTVEACVICRGSEPTGFVTRPPVPVLSENSFVSLLNRDRSLPKLWKLLNDRPDLAAAAKQFQDVKYTLLLAGYEFVIPGLAR